MHKLWKRDLSTGKWCVIERSESLEAISLAHAHCLMYQPAQAMGQKTFYVQATGGKPPEGATDEQG